MQELKHWMKALEANLFQLTLNYSNLSMEDTNKIMKNIADCLEGLVEVKVNERLEALRKND